MSYLLSLVSLLAVLALARSATTTSGVTSTLATAGALPIEDLRNVRIPTYTSSPGLVSQITYYATSTAIASASVPFTTISAGVSSSAAAAASLKERDLNKRTACDPQPTISNYYGVNISNYTAFQADPIISSVANAAPTPAGYSQDFKNLTGANNAYAYMGYTTVNTGYNVTYCANQCDAITGCLAFNIYFELDPTEDPGTGCTDPPGFANIKCSFWGAGLDASTATNYGQVRSSFQVAVAGSNAYTSYKLGGSVDGYTGPSSLNNSIISAPSQDCSGASTYLGYELFQSGPFDPRLCKAACDAQTAYDVSNPPASGQVVECSAFDTYMLTMSNSSGSYSLGQMCQFYTSTWDPSYATNNVTYDATIGANYTYSYSFFYSEQNEQPICTSDINYLISNGSDFCTSYISYSAPSTTTTITITPTGFVTDLVTTTLLASSTRTSSTVLLASSTLTTTKTVVASTTQTTTTTLVVSGSQTTTTTGNVQWKRDESNATLTTSYQTVSSVAPYSIAILATLTAAPPVPLLNETTISPTTSTVSASGSLQKRQASSAVPTPASISSWPASRISEACSQVATGTITVTSTASLASSTTTVVSSATSTVLATQVVSATSTTLITAIQTITSTATSIIVQTATSTTLSQCIVPTQLSAYSTFAPIAPIEFGTWSGTAVGSYCGSNIYAGFAIQLPFPLCVLGHCTSVMQVYLDGFATILTGTDVIYLQAFSTQGGGLHLYSGQPDGVFYRVTGDVGHRQIVLAWYAGTAASKLEQNHFTITLFEDKDSEVLFKYYDVVQSSGPQAVARVIYGTALSILLNPTVASVWPSGSYFQSGMQFNITLPATDKGLASVQQSTHDPIACCTKSGWHSCTEYQPSLE